MDGLQGRLAAVDDGALSGQALQDSKEHSTEAKLTMQDGRVTENVLPHHADCDTESSNSNLTSGSSTSSDCVVGHDHHVQCRSDDNRTDPGMAASSEQYAGSGTSSNCTSSSSDISRAHATTSECASGVLQSNSEQQAASATGSTSTLPLQGECIKAYLQRATQVPEPLQDIIEEYASGYKYLLDLHEAGVVDEISLPSFGRIHTHGMRLHVFPLDKLHAAEENGLCVFS